MRNLLWLSDGANLLKSKWRKPASALLWNEFREYLLKSAFAFSVKSR
jgi:hypothetical protein